MILDTISNWQLYADVHPNVKKALQYLANLPTDDLQEGRHDIDGDRVYALIQLYDTEPADDRKFEAHQDYIDVQYVHRGTETIYWQVADSLTPIGPYDSDSDCILYKDAKASALRLTDGMFTILYPHDSHKPCCVADMLSPVQKIVVKCRLK